MGFAEIKKKETPLPRYKNTVVCHKCHAEYNKDVQFVKGITVSSNTGTDLGDFIPLATIRIGTCPMCSTSEKITL